MLSHLFFPSIVVKQGKFVGFPSWSISEWGRRRCCAMGAVGQPWGCSGVVTLPGYISG